MIELLVCLSSCRLICAVFLFCALAWTAGLRAVLMLMLMLRRSLRLRLQIVVEHCRQQK